jgi:hypothetical protein
VIGQYARGQQAGQAAANYNRMGAEVLLHWSETRMLDTNNPLTRTVFLPAGLVGRVAPHVGHQPKRARPSAVPASGLGIDPP